jgi:hypothetical protein
MQAPVIILMIAFFLIGGIVVFSLNNRFRTRELDHKEKLAAIEKGVDLPARETAPWTPRTYLLHGMIWLFAGLGSMLAIFAIAATSGPSPMRIPIGLGFLGLIPIGVGLAYLIFYRIESRKLLS